LRNPVLLIESITFLEHACMKTLDKTNPKPRFASGPIAGALKQLTLAGLALAVSTRAQASLLVYEGFNYAGQNDSAALNGAAFNGGIGLSGTWAGAGKYRAAGLSFSDLAVAGGCAEGTNAEIYYRKLNVNQTGTIWGSFLFKSVSAVDTTTNLSDLIVSRKANGNDWQIETNFGVAPKKYNGTTSDIRLGGNTNPPDVGNNTGGVAVAQNTTYLVLFKVQNLTPSGGVATGQTLTSWILSAEQYDNFKSGGLTEAELNAAAQGGGAANVMQRTTLTATQKASFSVNDFLTVQSNNVGDYMHDEIRFSDASLAEVAPNTGALVWNVAGGGAWDTSTVNWKDSLSGAATSFSNGKNAIFDNVAGGTITLATGISPATTTVSATSGTYAFSGVLGGTGSLIKSNGGDLNLDGENTYTGGTVINAGVVSCSLSNPSPLGDAGSVNVTVQSGATLALNRNQITGSLTLNGGKIATGNGWGDDAWNGPIVLGATSIVDVGATDGRFNMNGVVSGPGGLIKLGATSRPTPLNGPNTFTGPVSVQAGAIQVASLNRISGGTAYSNLGAPTTVADGTISLGSSSVSGSLNYTGPGETTDRVIKLAGTTGGAVISQAGTGTYFTTSRGQSGLLKFTSDVSIPGSIDQDNVKTLTLYNQGSVNETLSGRGEISGKIGDSVLGNAGSLATSIVKAGLGSWTLSGKNSYTGGTKVQAGTLAFSQPESLGSGSLDITTGAKVQLNYIGTLKIPALTFDAGAAKPNGTYGSSLSMATFKDDTHFTGLGTVTIGVSSGVTTTTTLVGTSVNATSNGGEIVTFTATVQGSSPTGNVMFYDGLKLLGTSALNTSSKASIRTNGLSAGDNVISALYVGDTGNASSSSSLTQTVVETRTLVTTTNALTSGANPSAYAAAVTFSVTVAGSSPTGNVMFYNGSNPIGISTLNGSGIASLTFSSLPVGWQTITARYLGDATHLPSATATTLFQTVNPPVGNGKLKIFILAGQSNMLGKGKVEFGRNPSNFSDTNFAGGLGTLRNMLNREPNKYGYLVGAPNPIAGGVPGWLTPTDVYVTDFSAQDRSSAMVSKEGDLAPIFGNAGVVDCVGPEYGFGLSVGSQLADKVLIIKYSVGGLSLAADFRPPSSGGAVGPYYSGLIARVNSVIANLSPADKLNYEIAGFGWHQGFNDRINSTSAAEYESNMANLIKDVRSALGVSKLPVSIGNTGMDVNPDDAGAMAVIAAQAAVANPVLHPELFAGTVTTVDTRPFNYGEQFGASSEGYHWFWNGESYFNIGDSMGKAMMSMIQSTSSAKDILSFSVPGQTSTTINGSNISVTMPAGTDITNLAPTYSVSVGASGSVVSGTTRDFTIPQTYTITAQDLTTKVYTVTLTFASSNSTFTWATPVTNGDWGTAAKWMENVAPVSNGNSSYVLNFNAAGTYTANNNLNAGFQLNRINFGGSTVTLSGNLLTLTANGATLPTINQSSTSPVIINAPLNLQSNATVGGTAIGEMTFASTVSGGGRLIKTSNGKLTLSGTNSYSGGTVINAGTITLANRTGLGSGPLTLAAGTVFQQSNFEGNNVAGALPNSWSLSGNGFVTLNMPFSQKDVWLNQVVSGTGGLSVQGGVRSITLTAANTFSGGIRLTNADNRVQISHLRALGTGIFRSMRSIENSGQLIPLANLSTAPGVANAFDIDSGAYLNVFADGANNLLLSGPITNTVGNGNLYKSGSATLTLSGVNTYTGSTKIAAGTLACNSATALSTGSVVILTGAKLNLNFTSIRQIQSLTLGTTVQAIGTYGSMASSATNKSNYFSGPGVVNVTSNVAARLAVAQSAPVTSSQVTNSVSGLPLPWASGMIGSGSLTGTSTYTAGTISQSGSGALGNTSDKLNFNYQTLSGDGEITAKINALQDTGTLSGVGVMIRETLASDSKHVFMGMTGSNTYVNASRTTTGGISTTGSVGTGTVPNTWVKLVRVGDVITASKSLDGITWTAISSTTVTMATTCYIGLAVSSGTDAVLNNSQFTNLSVTP
jgi:fibronectin-binding autotransporter adhesin